MTTPRIEEIKDKIYYEHLEDILTHAELKVHALDEKQHVDDQRERIHKMLDLVIKLITEAHQAGIDEVVEVVQSVKIEGKAPKLVKDTLNDWLLPEIKKNIIKALQDNK